MNATLAVLGFLFLLIGWGLLPKLHKVKKVLDYLELLDNRLQETKEEGTREEIQRRMSEIRRVFADGARKMGIPLDTLALLLERWLPTCITSAALLCVIGIILLFWAYIFRK